jgi:uncharacterized membrane protein YeaQ/YmgE (transglycosylase-associated protein family)
LSLRGNAGLLPLGAHTLAAMSAGVIVAILISGFFTGMLARLAVPGPDPMPLWLTISIGLTGSIAGAVVAKALFSDNGYVVSFGSLGVAIALVLAYRRFVQHRPLWGPEALRFPERGVGVEGYRERLQKLGVDPNALAADPRKLEAQRLRAMLQELRRAGIIDDAELEEKLRRVEERQA